MDGSDLDNNLVTQTQRPALTQEKYIRVPSLKEDSDIEVLEINTMTEFNDNNKMFV